MISNNHGIRFPFFCKTNCSVYGRWRQKTPRCCCSGYCADVVEPFLISGWTFKDLTHAGIKPSISIDSVQCVTNKYRTGFSLRLKLVHIPAGGCMCPYVHVSMCPYVLPTQKIPFPILPSPTIVRLPHPLPVRLRGREPSVLLVDVYEGFE